MFGMTILLEAGAVKPDQGALAIAQGWSAETAQTVADWLALATDGPVRLHHMGGGTLLDGPQIIEASPESVRAKAQTITTREHVPRGTDTP
jgi:hypothetical protein